MASSTVVFLLFLGLVTMVAHAEDSSEDSTDVSDRFSVSSDQLPSVDLSTLSNLAVSAGAAALGVAGLAIIVLLVLHMFGVKRCHLLGTCDALAAATAHFAGPSPMSAGVPQYQLDNAPYSAYAVQQQNAPANSYPHEGNSFQKRSIEHLGPVLRSIASAYEKYGEWNSAK